jgi:hypothetical protein
MHEGRTLVVVVDEANQVMHECRTLVVVVVVIIPSSMMMTKPSPWNRQRSKSWKLCGEKRTGETKS